LGEDEKVLERDSGDGNTNMNVPQLTELRLLDDVFYVVYFLPDKGKTKSKGSCFSSAGLVEFHRVEMMVREGRCGTQESGFLPITTLSAKFCTKARDGEAFVTSG
jgi:hypothetical protein